jgi:acyl dehydratase
VSATTYAVDAFNTATASTNKIHDDAVARSYGFRGGLVPGVDVYAYLTQGPVARWGAAWLADGTMSARFAKPVYDGDEVTVDVEELGGRLDLRLSDPHHELCASGRATLHAPSERHGPLPAEALPARRPPASAESLRPGTVLGSLHEVFDASAHGSYLADVREANPIYASRGLAHPGWLLRFANSILARNVELGPWIHVGSDVVLSGVVHDGEPVDARSVVLDEHERKGHRFVVLDVALTSDERDVQRITHTAIHTPRRQRP